MQAGKSIIFGSVVVLLLTSCAAEKPCPRTAEDEPPAVSVPALPSFVLEALQSEGAQSVKLYFAKDGTIRKSAVYVTKETLPDWVHTMADEKLGQGKDEEYEVEEYRDGAQAYEITRKIKGVSQELSVTVDKTVRYIEKKLKKKDLPENVAAAIQGLEGFKMDEAESKTLPDGTVEYEVEGTEGGINVQYKMSAAGEILSQSRMFTAKVTADR
jgi:hypothetical protein